MIKRIPAQNQKPIKSHAPPVVDTQSLRQKLEEKEVAGRHQNDGQKHFKGAR